MERSTLIKFIDVLSFTSLTLMISTGILVKFTLPPGSGRDEVWGLTRHEWGDIHFYISIIFLLLIASHLITHFRFIKLVITGKAPAEKNYRVAFGLLGVIALIALAFAPVTSMVTEGDNGQQHRFHKN